MKPSSTVTTIVSSAASLAALAGAVAMQIAFGWEAARPLVNSPPPADPRQVLAAPAAPALAMREHCDELAPRRGLPYVPAPAPLQLAAGATWSGPAGDGDASGGVQPPHAPRPCGADETGAARAERRVEGLGSGWIISADGVMHMNPYSLSDRHTITVRPADAVREFKSRVIGLDPLPDAAARAGAHDAAPSPLERPPSVPATSRTVRKTT